jgi:hypothetical protein
MEWLSEREREREREKEREGEEGKRGRKEEKERAKKRQEEQRRKASALREWMWLRSSLSFLKTSKSPELAGYHHLLPMNRSG